MTKGTIIINSESYGNAEWDFEQIIETLHMLSVERGAPLCFKQEGKERVMFLRHDVTSDILFKEE